MASVTQRIRQIVQPYGGYLSPLLFKVKQYQDGYSMKPESVEPGIAGLAADYLTRFLCGADRRQAFRVSLFGAALAREKELSESLLSKISGDDDISIDAACKLAGFDVCARAGISKYEPAEYIRADKSTAENIRVMLNRSRAFFKEYGPVVKDGFTFEGGYTDTVDKGDGDFLTRDTIWEFKVSKYGPTEEHTLQLLMYYIMGRFSDHTEFDSVRRLGIFNPRLYRVYTLDTADIDPVIISKVARDVICY